MLFLYMSQLLLLGKFEYGGGPIFKVVLDGWMDGFTSGYRVATALRIVYWPSLSLLGLLLRGQVGCSS